MRVLVAPDKFKASATAPAVADAVARGLRVAAPTSSVATLPVADGGDGTVDVLVAAGDAALTVPALDALGRPAQTVAAVRGCRVVLELARFAGLARLSGAPAPLAAGSAGLGVAVAAVLARGYRDLVVGLGGSASTDGGLGLLLALGAVATDAAGHPVTPDGAGLLRVADVDLKGVTLPPGTRLRLACDVDAPLAGPRGAATVFAPQKGADADAVARLDAALARWGALLGRAVGHGVADVPGAGAAGGIGAAGIALGAEVVGGASFVLDSVGFDDALERADVVVTGEGSWDAQSASGKAPALVTRRARQMGTPVVLVAGRVAPGTDGGFAQVHSLTAMAGSRAAAMRDAVPLLERAGAAIGRALREPADAVTS